MDEDITAKLVDFFRQQAPTTEKAPPLGRNRPWPRFDLPHAIFVGRAINLLGVAMFGADWRGTELNDRSSDAEANGRWQGMVNRMTQAAIDEKLMFGHMDPETGFIMPIPSRLWSVGNVEDWLSNGEYHPDSPSSDRLRFGNFQDLYVQRPLFDQFLEASGRNHLSIIDQESTAPKESSPFEPSTETLHSRRSPLPKDEIDFEAWMQDGAKAGELRTKKEAKKWAGDRNIAFQWGAAQHSNADSSLKLKRGQSKKRLLANRTGK